MTITWLGHSCFALEENGYRMVIDPYHDTTGYPDLHTQAHEVLCSHDHFDHGYTEAVTLLPAAQSPFTIRTIPTFHDEQQGELRGSNTIHIIKSDALTVVHLGDLGHPLKQEQLSAIGPADVVMVPVGGFYTIDGALAYETVTAIGAGTIVPMHYRFGDFGFREIETAEPFLSHFAPEEICRLEGCSFTAEKKDRRQVIIPKYV